MTRAPHDVIDAPSRRVAHALLACAFACAQLAVSIAIAAPALAQDVEPEVVLFPRAPGMPGLHHSRPDFEELIQGPARTWKEMRDAGVIRQGHDYSCGSAALATLLSGSDPDVTEREILLEVLEGLSDDDKRLTMEQGLSLLDLKGAATRRGFQAEGYRIDPEFLLKITRPVIVFIEPGGYRHFAVLKGVRGDRVFLADPARGNVRMPAFKFLDMWQGEDGKGVIFVVGSTSPPLLAVSEEVNTQPELMAASQLLRIGPIDASPVFSTSR